MSTAIAIVGLSCVYPDANDPEALWDLAVSGRRCFRPIPSERLDLPSYAADLLGEADSITPVHAALIADYRFDRTRFRIPENCST